jgi:hypothetical protein
LRFGESVVEITTVDEIIHLRVTGAYTDEMALAMLEQMDRLIEAMPGDPVRVWDASGIPADSFLLTSECIDAVARWAVTLKQRRPGSMAYMISPTLVSFGMARMYGMKSELEPEGVRVLRSVDELPAGIRERLPVRR